MSSRQERFGKASGWVEVVADFQSGTSGAAVSTAVVEAGRYLRSDCVVVSDLVPDENLRQGQEVAHLEELSRMAKAIGHVPQLEWGDFFFFRQPTEARAALAGCRWVRPFVVPWYVYWISKASLVLRCVDSTYMYYYGTDMETRAWVRHQMHPSESKEGNLGDLGFPR